jgi:hypothetical protein
MAYWGRCGASVKILGSIANWGDCKAQCHEMKFRPATGK